MKVPPLTHLVGCHIDTLMYPGNYMCVCDVAKKQAVANSAIESVRSQKRPIINYASRKDMVCVLQCGHYHSQAKKG